MKSKLAFAILAATTAWATPCYAQNKARDSLSAEDRTALITHIVERLESCWLLTIATPPTTIPIVSVDLDRDGYILTKPKLVNPMKDETFMTVANSGIRALNKCKNLNIPDKFHYGLKDYKKLRIRLDPINLDQKK